VAFSIASTAQELAQCVVVK